MIPTSSPASKSSPLLEVDGVTLEYRTDKTVVTATRRVSFTVHQSDRFVLLGPSGCGKSTLLKAIGGFLRPVEGQIRLKGQAVTRPGPNRMIVFQEFDQLLPWKTVLGNVVFTLTNGGGLSQKEAMDRASVYIEKVKLSKFAHSYPHTLSGGMKQRVAIARGMALEPEVLLMDEPFAALDEMTRTHMQDELLALWGDTRTTILFVTHSITEAVKVGTRILLLTPHPGEVKCEMQSSGSNEVGSDGLRLSERVHQALFGSVHERAALQELGHG